MTSLPVRCCARCQAPLATDQLTEVQTWKGPRRVCATCRAVWVRLRLAA